MADQHRIGLVGVERAVGLVGKFEAGQPGAAGELQRIGEARELRLDHAHRVAAGHAGAGVGTAGRSGKSGHDGVWVAIRGGDSKVAGTSCGAHRGLRQGESLSQPGPRAYARTPAGAATAAAGPLPAGAGGDGRRRRAGRSPRRATGKCGEMSGFAANPERTSCRPHPRAPAGPAAGRMPALRSRLPSSAVAAPSVRKNMTMFYDDGIMAAQITGGAGSGATGADGAVP